jgi:hypothetical protein
LVEAFVQFFQLCFDVLKAAREAIDGLGQDFFRFDFEEARDVDHRKEQVAYFLAGSIPVAGCRSFLQFAYFSSTFSQTCSISGLETEMRRPS